MAEKIQSNLLSEDNLESLRTLVPGDTVDLQIAMPAAPKRVKTDYIGMLIDECLLFHIGQCGYSQAAVQNPLLH